MQAYHDGAMDIINLKISKLGGIYKSKQIRDLCVELKIPMTIEDSWGGDIATAAISHLAHSTPEKFRFSSTDFNSYNSLSYTEGSPKRTDGRMRASDNYGLGVELDFSILGEPEFIIN